MAPGLEKITMPGQGYLLGLQGLEKTAAVGTALKAMGSMAWNAGKGLMAGGKALANGVGTMAGRLNAATGGKLGKAGKIGGYGLTGWSGYEGYQALKGTLRSGTSLPRAFG